MTKHIYPWIFRYNVFAKALFVVLLQKSNHYVSGLFQKKITVARQPKSLLGSILKVRFKFDFRIDFKLKNWHKDKFLVD